MNAGELCDMEMDIVENILEEIYPEGIDDELLNNIFWFEFDTVLSWLGYEPNEE